MLIQIYLVISALVFTLFAVVAPQDAHYEIFIKFILLVLAIVGAIAAYSSF